MLDTLSKKCTCPSPVPLLEDHFSTVERPHVQAEPRVLVEAQRRFLESDNYKRPVSPQVRKALSRQEVVAWQQGRMAARLRKLVRDTPCLRPQQRCHVPQRRPCGRPYQRQGVRSNLQPD